MSWRPAKAATIALVIATLALSGSTGSAATRWWSHTRVTAFEHGLGVGYNRVAVRRGPVAGMGWVYQQAVQALPHFPTQDRAPFKSTLVKWALAMQEPNPELAPTYAKFNARFGGGRVWQWRRSQAQDRVDAFNWAGQRALRISCKGVWNQNANYSHGVGWFTDFRCEFWQSDGWSNFHLRTISDNNFRTSDWHAGRTGSSEPASPSAPSGGDCATESGTHFTLNGVSCGEAVNVWFAYTRGNQLAAGWSCIPHLCQGPPDYSGIGGSFTWRP